MIKMIVWDCDETLWEGKIIYGQVFLKYETKEVLKQLDKLGILQYVCSKNDFEPLKKQLEAFGIAEYFKGVKASWDPKSKMMKEILKETGIEPERVLFIDDETINRDEVKQLAGCHTDFEIDLYNVLKYFDTERILTMKQQRVREKAEKEFKGTFKEFLENSGMVCDITPANKDMLARITNLANRTNELNAARNRYSEEAVKSILESKNHSVWVAFLKDKYGDYGLIGEIIIEKQKDDIWFIKDVCISCRTMGRGIGKKLIEYVKQQAKLNNVKSLHGVIEVNEENFRMPRLYVKCGFKEYQPAGAKQGYTYYEYKN